MLAGLPPNRVPVTSEVRPLALAADAILDFTVPAATVKLAALAAETHLAHIIGTTGMSAKDDAATELRPPEEDRDRQVRQHEPRRQSARRADQEGRAGAG